jgi:hypothetical protein
LELEFYTRSENETQYINDVLEISDELSILITQIETCLFTQKQDVIGQQDFGVNLEDLIFTFKKNEAEIKSVLLNQIYTYCPLAGKYNVDISVIFQKTPERDVGYIDVIVNDLRTFGILI